jgi:hypothetical protein
VLQDKDDPIPVLLTILVPPIIVKTVSFLKSDSSLTKHYCLWAMGKIKEKNVVQSGKVKSPFGEITEMEVIFRNSVIRQVLIKIKSHVSPVLMCCRICLGSLGLYRFF